MSPALIEVPVVVSAVVIIPISPLPPGAPPLIAAAVAVGNPPLRWRWRDWGPAPAVILTMLLLLLPIVFGGAYVSVTAATSPAVVATSATATAILPLLVSSPVIILPFGRRPRTVSVTLLLPAVEGTLHSSSRHRGPVGVGIGVGAGTLLPLHRRRPRVLGGPHDALVSPVRADRLATQSRLMRRGGGRRQNWS